MTKKTWLAILVAVVVLAIDLNARNDLKGFSNVQSRDCSDVVSADRFADRVGVAFDYERLIQCTTDADDDDLVHSRFRLLRRRCVLGFPLKKVLWVTMLSTMFIPGITILITSVRVVSALGMIDTLAVLILPGLVSAYNIFFFRQFYLGFPKALDEAARIDGAKTLDIFRLIYIPMSKTPMVIIGASVFMGYYNSYLWPTLTITQDRKDLFQIMYVIRMLFSDASVLGYGSVLAATFVSLIFPLMIFMVV